jgi:hypothetical protein
MGGHPHDHGNISMIRITNDVCDKIRMSDRITAMA